MASEISNTRVSEFYDSFKKHQQKLGVNIRHRTIYKNLRRDGLRAESNVLEIGCGIGTVSSLILKTVTIGKFIGVDISSGSIEAAKHLNKNYRNAEFVVNDMSSFTSLVKFDYVVFPDVLEHIPVENHENIFNTVSSLLSAGGKVHINIPSPSFQRWLRRNHPDKMQIIDQALNIGQMVSTAHGAGLELISAMPYSLQYSKPDYLYLIMEKQPKEEEFVRKSWLVRGTENFLSKI
jgi:trans-aconitate 2-methyltransferase